MNIKEDPAVKRISKLTKKGMSLTELIIVVAIMVIILAVVFVSFAYNLDKASEFTGMMGGVAG